MSEHEKDTARDFRIEELEKRVRELEILVQTLVHQLPQVVRMGTNQAVQTSATANRRVQR